MRTHRKFVHWIATVAILMSAVAPAVSQAVSIAKGGHGFAMEICSVDGSKMQINIADDQPSDQSGHSQPCPYCLEHVNFTPSFLTNPTFEVPQTFVLLPRLFYQSPKLHNVWLTPPSAAPPTQA